MIELKSSSKPLQHLPSPERMVGALLVCIVSTAIFLDYWSYSRQFYSEPRAYRDVLDGTAIAPNQYRVGAVWLANFIAVHGHVGLRHGLTLLDGISAALAVCLLYSILRGSDLYREGSNLLRWVGSGAFLVLVQFYLAWLIWYQRPETLPTAALLAIALWLLTPAPRPLPAWVLPIGLLLFSVAQSLIRADVAVAVDLGIFLVCCSRWGSDLSLSRGAMTAVAFIGALLGGGIQFWLMHVVYPNASYGSTPVFQLLMNLRSPLRIFPFLIFMLPWAWTLRYFVRHKNDLVVPSAAMLTGSALFLPLWCMVGKIDEVRIFLPFALALGPLTVQAVMRRASPKV